MNTQQIETLLRELELPIPKAVWQRIQERDRGPGAGEVEAQVQWLLRHGEPAETAERHARQKVQDDKALLVDRAITGSTAALLDLKRAATLELFRQFRVLGDDVPGSAEAALYASAAMQAKYHKRQAQAERYGRLYRLHRLLLNPELPRPSVNPTAWALFGDTRAWPPPSGSYRAPSVAAGDHDEPFAEALPVRLEYLASGAGRADFWQPDAQECTDYYLKWCGRSTAATSPTVEPVAS